MIIQNEVNESSGRFFIEDNKRTLAEMDYLLPGNAILLIVHTEVDESLAGKGIGKQLVSAAVDYARDKGYVLKVTCPFAKKVLERSPEFYDVYQPDKK